jgi:hypothetical protein
MKSSATVGSLPALGLLAGDAVTHVNAADPQCGMDARRLNPGPHPRSAQGRMVTHPTRLSACLFVAALGSSLLPTSADTPLVNHGDAWHYHQGTTAPQVDWKSTTDSGLDASWLTGNGGFGYADNSAEVAGVQTPLGDMLGTYATVFMRRTFEVASEVDPDLRLMLTMDWDDGFIAWLDGVYLTSANSPGAPAEPTRTATATATHESSLGNSSPNSPTTSDLGTVGSRLPVGPHVLAIIGLNQSSGSSDFIQIADLSLAPPPPPATNPVSGVLTTDTTFYARSNVYTVISDLTVASGATLTIEPGVRAYLNPGVNFIVADGGRLIAEGTAQAPIDFTRAPGTTTAWGGITVNGGVGSPETRIAYAYLEGNGKTCLEVAGGTLYLDHTTFGTATHQYVSLDGSSFLISHCRFPSSTTSFELVHGTGGIKSGGHGIVRDCFFGTTSGYSDIMDFTGGNRDQNQPIIQYYNNVFLGASDDILDLDGTDAWIEGNLFLHSHKNGNTPDSSAAVSGGNTGGDTSEVTIIGNLIFDCDNAATAKQGNFFTLINNTIVHTTKTGGIDTASGVVCVRDLDPTPTTFGRGFYLEGNIIVDAEQLVRNYVAGQTTVTMNNNILPMAWSGPGSGNVIADPLLKHIPQISETYFTDWADAQVLRDWFSLLPESPALGTGPNGLDQGGEIPFGASISGEPIGTTSQTEATLTIGVNRTGSGIPASGWPNGSGYTHYRWRLDSGAWSAETPIGTPISLSGLADGLHYVEVVGKRDSGYYQDDPAFGPDATITRSRTWMVQSQTQLKITSASVQGTDFTLHFIAEAGKTYTVQYQDSLDALAWSKATDVPTQPATGDYWVTELPMDGKGKFYRVVTPAQP